jgi:hypothetical protein
MRGMGTLKSKHPHQPLRSPPLLHSGDRTLRTRARTREHDGVTHEPARGRARLRTRSRITEAGWWTAAYRRRWPRRCRGSSPGHAVHRTSRGSGRGSRCFAAASRHDSGGGAHGSRRGVSQGLPLPLAPALPLRDTPCRPVLHTISFLPRREDLALPLALCVICVLLCFGLCPSVSKLFGCGGAALCLLCVLRVLRGLCVQFEVR